MPSIKPDYLNADQMAQQARRSDVSAVNESILSRDEMDALVKEAEDDELILSDVEVERSDLDTLDEKEMSQEERLTVAAQHKTLDARLEQGERRIGKSGALPQLDLRDQIKLCLEISKDVNLIYPKRGHKLATLHAKTWTESQR